MEGTTLSARKPQSRHARAIQAPPTQGRDVSQAWPVPLRYVLILVSVLCLVVSAVGWWTVGRAAGNLGSGGDFSLGQEKDGATDILLVGSDSRADAQGNLWVRTTAAASKPGALVYDVIDAQGALVDRVEVPAGRQIMGFGPDGSVYLMAREGVGPTATTTLERARVK